MTWLAIHEAAVHLIVEQGFAASTVEAIAEAAGVSRRTFFNYFPSKEDAVLGLVTPACSDQAVGAFEQQLEDPLRATTTLLMAVIRSGWPKLSGDLRRQELVDSNPVLLERSRQHFQVAADLTLEQVLARMPELRDGLDLPRATRDADAAHALVALSVAVLRYLLTRDLKSTLDPESPVLDDALTLFRALL